MAVGLFEDEDSEKEDGVLVLVTVVLLVLEVEVVAGLAALKCGLKKKEKRLDGLKKCETGPAFGCFKHDLLTKLNDKQ